MEHALPAIAVGRLLGVAPGSIAAAFAHFVPLRRRAEVSPLKMGGTLINDCYNSNPRALEQMLELLRDWPGAVRRIVVAGEMLELGPTSPEWHRRAGAQAAANRVDWLVAVQGDARLLLEGAEAAGFAPDRARFFDDPYEAGEFCRSILRDGDVVLVKGSRGVRLEKAIEALVGG